MEQCDVHDRMINFANVGMTETEPYIRKRPFHRILAHAVHVGKHKQVPTNKLKVTDDLHNKVTPDEPEQVLKCWVVFFL